jgi:hypothetical protein
MHWERLLTGACRVWTSTIDDGPVPCSCRGTQPSGQDNMYPLHAPKCFKRASQRTLMYIESGNTYFDNIQLNFNAFELKAHNDRNCGQDNSFSFERIEAQTRTDASCRIFDNSTFGMQCITKEP